MHKTDRKDISISGEEIFLPTDPNEVGGKETSASPEGSVTSLDTTVDYSPLPTKPEEIE